jgi:hypothetical protein
MITPDELLFWILILPIIIFTNSIAISGAIVLIKGALYNEN